KGVTCLDCHQPVDGQEPIAHSGFTLAAEMTALNCRQCHQTEYEEFLRSRHAAPAFAAVAGAKDFTEAQIVAAEKYHPGAVRRPANALAIREGEGVLDLGCLACHNIGQPNSDGSIGSCTQCHSRHAASVALARQPETCGQCHMGPDHSQLEIFNESKHGILWAHYKSRMNLNAPAKSLTTRDIPVPSCSTCHMSGLEEQRVTHDVTERLSWWLFAPVSKKRPTYDTGQTNMQDICMTCHASSQVDEFYEDAEIVVHSTNQKVQAALDLVKALRDEGHLTPEPFDEPIDFLIFDLWHYYGRTAKHGAFMGGADFVQWHGNYELLLKMTELEEMAAELRGEK
ncbi:MAG: nitrate reductase, partial [Planctomycetes bacterium]|nr:nitrate reductase [Planctomycetota bacterium]